MPMPLRFSADTSDEAASVLKTRAEKLMADLGEAQSFFRPEILKAPQGAALAIIDSLKELTVYRQYFREIERARAHTLSSEVESVLETLSPLESIPNNVRTALHDSEMKFRSFSVHGKRHVIDHGQIDHLLASPDREVRQRAYEGYTDAYIRLKQSLAETLGAQATSSFLFNKVRNFSSTFEAKMFGEAFPPEVFSAVLGACRENRHLFHRYFKARAAILGIPRVAEYDLMAPLSTNPPSFPYARAQEIVLDALKPLGDEYVSIARSGLHEERWVDVYPRPGKYSNAFSGGVYGTRPFLLLNYGPTMTEVGTLAHELGHSMHSYITNRSQPSCYAAYATSVAETASNLNQVLLRAKVLESADRDATLSVLEEAFFYAHRYLFLMPTMSEVEHALHSRYAESGATMGASELCESTVTAFTEAYGDSVDVEPARLGVKWASFVHFYDPYYFFQYAIGVAAAMNIGQRILAKEPGAVEKYMRFLSAGASDYTPEIFKIIDIDITSPEPYRAAFKVVEGYVSTLEALAGKAG